MLLSYVRCSGWSSCYPFHTLDRVLNHFRLQFSNNVASTAARQCLISPLDETGSSLRLDRSTVRLDIVLNGPPLVGIESTTLAASALTTAASRFFIYSHFSWYLSRLPCFFLSASLRLSTFFVVSSFRFSDRTISLHIWFHYVILCNGLVSTSRKMVILSLACHASITILLSA